MNIIINKLDLPCDLKNEIHKYIYNSEGYTVDDLNAIKKQKNKKRNKFMKLRQKLELAEWYTYNVSVCWLRGGGAYGRKHPTSCWGGGTLFESQEFRFYNRNKKINDPDNDYIYKKLKQGDRRRNYF